MKPSVAADTTIVEGKLLNGTHTARRTRSPQASVDRSISKIDAVKAGKTRYIGISNCFAWQLAKANFYAREHGLTEFVSIQGHYNLIARADGRIIARVAELAEKRGVSMTEISLAWLLTKVTAPVVGATKFSHVEGAVRAADLKLTQEEIDYLEELYVPHALVGVMAQNGN